MARWLVLGPVLPTPAGCVSRPTAALTRDPWAFHSCNLNCVWCSLVTLCCCWVATSCPTLCDPVNCNLSGSPVLHSLPEFAQIHVHCIGDASQPPDSLPPPSPSALTLSQHQSLFKWGDSSHQVAKVLEFQLRHQVFQWIFRVDFL